jgi:hypothetical protein
MTMSRQLPQRTTRRGRACYHFCYPTARYAAVQADTVCGSGGKVEPEIIDYLRRTGIGRHGGGRFSRPLP